MKKFIVLVLVLCAAVATGYYFWSQSSQKNNVQNQYKFTPIARGLIEEVITSQGKLEAKEYVDVGTQVSGQLLKLHVELGDVVKKDDLIAEIDPKIYESQVQATEAQLKTLAAQKAQQQALVVQAEQKFSRNQTLFKKDAIAKETFQDAQTALNVAKAQLASIEAQIEERNSSLEETRTNLGYTKIYAPMAGTVVTQTSREGQTLNANQAAPVIVQIANLDVLTVRAQVAEADIMNIKPDMSVYFTILGSQDRRWEGKVRQVLPTPDIVNDVVLYNVLIDVDNTDRQLMLNMSTQMFFTLGRADNVITVPVSALGRRVSDKDKEGAKAYMIKVATPQSVEERLIYVGLMDRTNAEVKEGLSENDRIAEVNTGGGDNQKPQTRSARMPRF